MAENTPKNFQSSWDDLVESKSKYLKQSDVGEDGVVLTVRGFKREVLETDGNEEEEKTILYFTEAQYKPMVLGPTNRDLLKIATGAATPGEAKGKRVVVYADPTVSFGGKVTGGLRIRKVPVPKPVPKTVAQPAVSADFDDDVPF